MPRKRPRQRQRKAVASLFHHGARIKVPNHPPEFTSRPWFPLIVRIPDVSTITHGSLRTNLLTQLGFGAATNTLCVRIKSIRVWGPIPVTPAPLNCIFYDTFVDVSVSPTDSILEQITDFPDAVNRARVGYQYSDAQYNRSNVLLATSTLPFVSTSGAGPGSVAYVQLLWRVFSTTPE